MNNLEENWEKCLVNVLVSNSIRYLDKEDKTMYNKRYKKLSQKASNEILNVTCG